MAIRGRKAKAYPRWFKTRLNWLERIGVSRKVIRQLGLWRPMSDLAFQVMVNRIKRGE